jgi:hypothetical protein
LNKEKASKTEPNQKKGKEKAHVWAEGKEVSCFQRISFFT